MSHRGIKAAGAAKVRRRMRGDGYADGLAGRPAKYADAEYQASYRRGRERRAELHVNELDRNPMLYGWEAADSQCRQLRRVD